MTGMDGIVVIPAVIEVIAMFFRNTIHLGRISGIMIGIDYSWFIIFVLFVFLLGTGYLPVVAPGAYPGWYWATAVLTALLFFASVLLHELSHALVARRSNIPINNITLFIFGGVSQMEDEPQTPWDEFKMAIAGPLASVAIAVVFFGTSLLTVMTQSRLLFAAFTYLWFINIFLAVFNMLPGFPLDGGRVFRAAIWGWSGNLQKSTRIAALVGQTFGILFIIVGVGSLFYPAWRAYGGIWMALVGWFLVSAARSSYQQVVLREALRKVPIRDVMNPQVNPVPPDIAVEMLVTEYFLGESASTLPVERNGAVLGVVSVEDVRALPRDEWKYKTVADIMRPLSEEQVLEPEDDAWDAANRMAQSNRDRIIIAEHDHVEGLVTRGSILRWLQTHTRLAPGQA